jgi:hypothetical protein
VGSGGCPGWRAADPDPEQVTSLNWVGSIGPTTFRRASMMQYPDLGRWTYGLVALVLAVLLLVLFYFFDHRSPVCYFQDRVVECTPQQIRGRM